MELHLRLANKLWQRTRHSAEKRTRRGGEDARAKREPGKKKTKKKTQQSWEEDEGAGERCQGRAERNIQRGGL